MRSRPPKPHAEAIARKGVPATGRMRPTAAKTQGRGASPYAANIAGQNKLAQYFKRFVANAPLLEPLRLFPAGDGWTKSQPTHRAARAEHQSYSD
jgi:hypothetical protein